MWAYMVVVSGIVLVDRLVLVTIVFCLGLLWPLVVGFVELLSVQMLVCAGGFVFVFWVGFGWILVVLVLIGGLCAVGFDCLFKVLGLVVGLWLNWLD